MSREGHGCQVAFTETRIGLQGGESPDAIGFRAVGWADGSVLVECKMTRADFHADAKKPHRSNVPGMGRFRYFMCPEGVITADELPDRWGLLYVTPRRRIKPIAGAVCCEANGNTQGSWEMPERWREWTHPHDSTREVMLLTKLLQRVGDAEALNLRLREAEGKAQRAIKTNEKLRTELRAVRSELWTSNHHALIGAVANS